MLNVECLVMNKKNAILH